MGSDGLFDNLYDDDILKCLYPQLKSDNNDSKIVLLENPQNVAVCLAENAEQLSLD